MGWSRLKNGELIRRVEESGFQVFITSDQNLRYQQNLAGRQVFLLILSTNYWPSLREQVAKIQRAITVARPGEYLELSV
jgi:hypothetical protein